MNQDQKKTVAEEIITEVRFQGIEAKEICFSIFGFWIFVLSKETCGDFLVGNINLAEA